jgi:predicted DNA binding CopG/RHH family protein
MKKDVQVNIRINSELKKALEKQGLTVQKLVDQTLEQMFEVEIQTKVSLKKFAVRSS